MLRRGLTIGAASLALSATTASAAAPHATLRAEGRSKLTVAGRHFHAREHVRVVLNPSTRRDAVRHVRASRHGRFRVTFAHVPTGPCDGFAVVATGRAGSRALLTRMHPDCRVR